ncbi:MAG TPA: hypothetical protein VG992_01005 [Candidatus Saccharimonadales bacterium]|nr:hypothetical protein [Candidatus Saccharimonadales bacterium]
MIYAEQVQDLMNLDTDGVAVVPDYVQRPQLSFLQQEILERGNIAWRDAHEKYTNARGLNIVQNHLSYALRTTAGDQSVFTRLPRLRDMTIHITNDVQGLAELSPTLADWRPDEVVLHDYDDPEIGLSRHRDHSCYTGIIAILAVYGTCDFVSHHPKTQQATTREINSGDLVLLRAPGLINTDEEVRPDHAVQNLKTMHRLSATWRQDRQTGQQPLAHTWYDNWRSQTNE